MKSRLEIGGNSVSFISELPISQDISIKDIREIGKTGSTYTKTIAVPFSPDTDTIFENIFEVNAKRNNFNPNIKTVAKYFVNEVEVFNGYLQMLQINKKTNDNEITGRYECALIGENSNIFLAISGLYLTDIDFSDLDHTLTLTSPFMSDPKWNPTVGGSGYVYPYIDYGVNDYNVGQPVDYIWKFEWLKPAIFEREYLYRIFENAGYSWPNLATQYPNTTYGISVVIPCVDAGRLQIDAVTRGQAAFNAGRSADQNTNVAGTYAGATVNYAPSNTVLPFNDVTTSPYFDSSVPATTGFDTAGSYFEIPLLAYYDGGATVNLEITVNPPPLTVTHTGNFMGEVVLQKSTDGGATYSTVNSSVFSVAMSGLTTTTYVAGAQVAFSNNQSQVGDRFRVRLVNQTCAINFFTTGSVPITTGTTSIDITFQGGSTTNSSNFTAFVNRADLPYGGNVVMNDTIPKDVTQLDFLTSIIKTENLHLELIKGSTVYNILPREDFYDETDILDWTYKVDTTKDVEILPMGELEYKRYIFQNKQDYDYYNKLYFDTYKEIYGTYIKDVDNDFVSSENVISSVFSPTPVASWNGNAIICPRFWTMDSNALNSVKPLKVNIRRLLYTRLFTPQAYNSITAGSTTDALNSYPYAGDVFNPYVPTYDINFGTPRVLFWKFAGATYTNNNRYNERYSKYITEITDPNSKIVRYQMRLDEYDINTFSFRKIVFVLDSYYYVNAIRGYNPQEDSLCEVELLKLNKAAVFSPTTSSIDYFDPVGNSGSSNRARGNSFNVGNNNTNGGTDSFISGSGNVIGEGATNIQLINCTNVYVSGLVENFVGIGLSDVEIDSYYSNTTKSEVILNGQVKVRAVDVSGASSVNSTYNYYRVDCTSGDVTLTLVDTGEEITIQKVDSSANTVIIDGGGVDINGSSTKVLTTQYEKVKLVLSTEWYY